MKIRDIVIVLCIVGCMSLVANVVGTKAGIVESIPGLLLLMAIALSGIVLGKVWHVILAVAYVVTLGCVLTYPGFPGSAFISAQVAKVNFLALCTPILAYAGIAIGKDLDSFAKQGWRIIIVASVVFVGTYIASAIIAQMILNSLGQI